MSDTHALDPPSPFVVEWVRRVTTTVPARRRALDVAIGRGRHVDALAQAGFRVFGVDANLDAVRDAIKRGASRDLIVRGWCADLTAHPLPRARFELILVTRYLQRDLFPALREAVTPGGVVLYETFTEAQRVLGRGPTSPDHLLKAGELRAMFEVFEVVFYEEVVQRDAMARIVAVRP